MLDKGPGQFLLLLLFAILQLAAVAARNCSFLLIKSNRIEIRNQDHMDYVGCRFWCSEMRMRLNEWKECKNNNGMRFGLQWNSIALGQFSSSLMFFFDTFGPGQTAEGTVLVIYAWLWSNYSLLPTMVLLSQIFLQNFFCYSPQLCTTTTYIIWCDEEWGWGSLRLCTL